MRGLEPLSAARKCHFVHCFLKAVACSVSCYVSVRGLQVFGEILVSPRLFIFASCHEKNEGLSASRGRSVGSLFLQNELL